MAGTLQLQEQHANNQDWDIRQRMNALLLRDAQLSQQIQHMQLKMGGNKGMMSRRLGQPTPHQCGHPQLLGWNARSRVPLSDSSNMSSYFDDVTRFDPAATSAELSQGEYSSSICLSVHKVPPKRRGGTDRKPRMRSKKNMDFTSVSAIPENSVTSLRHKSSHGTFVNGPLYSTMNYPQNSTPEHTLSAGLSSVMDCDDQETSDCRHWDTTNETHCGGVKPSSRLDPTGRDSKLDPQYCSSSDEGIEGDDECMDDNYNYNYSRDVNPVYGNCPDDLAHVYHPMYCNRGGCTSCSGTSCSSDSSLMAPHNSYMTADSSESSSHIYEQIFIDDMPSRSHPLPTSQRPPCIGKEATPPVCRVQARNTSKVSFFQPESKLSLGSNGSSHDGSSQEDISAEASHKSLIDQGKALNYSVASSVHMKGMFCCGSRSKSKKGQKSSVSKKFKGLSKQLQKFGQDKTNMKTLAHV